MSTAASEASGIKLSTDGISATQNSNKNPWSIADIFVFAPAFTLADVLTITDVIGNPPISPEKIFPTPCAFNSRLVGVTLLYGSNASAASIFSSVSRLATIASVRPVVHTCGRDRYSNFGKIKKDIKYILIIKKEK